MHPSDVRRIGKLLADVMAYFLRWRKSPTEARGRAKSRSASSQGSAQAARKSSEA